MLETLIYVVVGLMVIFIPAIYIIRERNKNRHAKETLDSAVQAGLDEPVSLHPWINPDSCIGSGACVSACPEKDILGLVNNRGALINPSKCIGHGACADACPVDAIDLVIGSEKRGVDIPHITPSFETNIPGIYIAGELGGMGLIRNAVIQGKQAVENIIKSLEGNDQKDLDLLIIGAGPAGIAGALKAKEKGISFKIIDQDDLGGTILNYPRKKLVMTEPMDLPIIGKIKIREILKEQLLDIFYDSFSKADLKVISNCKVESILNTDNGFEVTTPDQKFEAKRLLLAIGRRGSPRKLNVDGEKSSKVAYKLIDASQFSESNILVVGGGDSAVEAAVSLSEQQGNKVSLSYRNENIFRAKPGNIENFNQAVENGLITPYYKSTVNEIQHDKVELNTTDGSVSIPNDQVFIMIGGELPTEFLKNVGIKFNRKHGEKLSD